MCQNVAHTRYIQRTQWGSFRCLFYSIPRQLVVQSISLLFIEQRMPWNSSPLPLSKQTVGTRKGVGRELIFPGVIRRHNLFGVGEAICCSSLHKTNLHTYRLIIQANPKTTLYYCSVETYHTIHTCHITYWIHISCLFSAIINIYCMFKAHMANQHHVESTGTSPNTRSPRNSQARIKLSPSYSPRLACMYCTKDNFSTMESLQIHVQAMHG